MPLSDIQINSQIRKVFVRHWIYLGQLAIRTAKGRVRIHGTIMKLPQVPGKITAVTLDTIEREIKRIPGVQKVVAEYDNWKFLNGRWTMTETPDLAQRLRAEDPTKSTSHAIDETAGPAPESPPV